MSDISDLAEPVETGWPPTQLLACRLCGALLWDAPKHYAQMHAFPCVVDDCTHRFYRVSDLNEHCSEFHAVDGRYPGADSAGDFTWHRIAEETP